MKRPRARKARPGLTRDQIVTAALALVDRRGLNALTMRGLGAMLGVEAMSLYRHIPGKAALVTAVVDQVLGEIPFPSPSGDWRADLLRAGRVFWRALVAHPHLVPLLSATPIQTPGGFVSAEKMLRLVVQAGFPPADAHQIFRVTKAYVIGSAMVNESDRARKRGGQRPSLDSPLLRRALDTGRIDREADFELGLRLLLEALEQQVANGR